MASAKSWVFLILVLAVGVLAEDEGEEGAEGEAGEGGKAGEGGEDAGGSGTPSERYNCPNDEGKHHVLLMVKTSNSLPTQVLCGGSLISQKWVLTAGHCDHKQMVAVVGQDLKMEKRTVHEIKDKLHCMKSNSQKYDILLLKLGLTIKWKFLKLIKMPFKKYDVISLPRKEDCLSPAANQKVKFVGWAETHLPGEEELHISKDHTPVPQCGYLQVTPCKEDFSTFKNDPDWVMKSFSYSKLVCAGSNVDNTCGGGAGGVMIYKGHLLGVVKGSTSNHCKGPVKFTSVCDCRQWIEEKIKK